MKWFITNPSTYYSALEEREHSLISSPLSSSSSSTHISSHWLPFLSPSISITSLFPSAGHQCLAFLSISAPYTGPPPILRNMLGTCLATLDMSSCFSTAWAAKQCSLQQVLSERRPEQVEVSARAWLTATSHDFQGADWYETGAF